MAKSYVTEPEAYDRCVIVDMSDPKVIESFIPLEKISEIYDHHFGFEDYWKEKLGDSSIIEYIGAAATLIWEEYKKRGFAGNISYESAILLSHAIVSNTANFQSNTTSSRDRVALRELEEIAKLSKGWQTRYFEEQQGHIQENIEKSIRHDTKKCNSRLLSEPYTFGQIEIWNADTFLEKTNLSDIFSSLGYEKWIFNLMSIQSGKTTIVSNAPELLTVLAEELRAPAEGNRIHVNGILFRKEILFILA